MYTSPNAFHSDKMRYENQSILRNHSLRFLWLLRKVQSGVFLDFLWRVLFNNMVSRYGLEIHENAEIGEGLYLGHAFGITVNSAAKLGRNINLHKGVTIGQENRGKRKGAPTVGDEVWVGVNSTIVGNITIDSDVLIAPNTFVNFDVPSHSIVVGNPAKIISCQDATKGYINRRV